jgi:hypothetical protein
MSRRWIIAEGGFKVGVASLYKSQERGCVWESEEVGDCDDGFADHDDNVGYWVS